MRIIDYLKERRLHMGLDEGQFADKLGINVNWASDLETDEDEINGLTIPQFKKLCCTLEVNAVDIFRIVPSNFEGLSLAEMIKNRREEKYWSIENLADRIGYESIVIESLESNEDLAAVCIDALKKIAMELELPLDLVLERL